MKVLKILFFVLLSSALFGQNPIDIANKYLHNIECHELLFVSIKKQKSSSFKLTKMLPFNSYSRKNIGYLEVIKDNSNVIIKSNE